MVRAMVTIRNLKQVDPPEDKRPILETNYRPIKKRFFNAPTHLMPDLLLTGSANGSECRRVLDPGGFVDETTTEGPSEPMNSYLAVTLPKPKMVQIGAPLYAKPRKNRKGLKMAPALDPSDERIDVGLYQNCLHIILVGCWHVRRRGFLTKI